MNSPSERQVRISPDDRGPSLESVPGETVPGGSQWARRARTLAAVYVLLLFTATHIPQPDAPSVDVSDKVIHFSAYLLLTLFVLLGWDLSIRGLAPKHFFAVWLAGTLYGAFDELTQAPVGRHCDMLDWLADVAGVLCGMILFQVGRSLVVRVFGDRSVKSLAVAIRGDSSETRAEWIQ